MRARTYLLRMLELVKMVVTARSRSEACFRCVVALRYVQMVRSQWRTMVEEKRKEERSRRGYIQQSK
jgi:hypothetical protein